MHLKSVHLLHDTFPTSDSYPFNFEIFHTTDYLEFRKPVTFFIGENGSGKSTLLKAIAQRCLVHIWREEMRARYHTNRYEDELHKYLDAEWTSGRVPGAFFASEMFLHFAQMLDEWAVADSGILTYFGNKSLMEKSHGQSHMAYFRHRFKIKGLYLLDEPENALSPRMQIELLKLFQQLSTLGTTQLIIATHSPILLAYPDAEIYSFDHAPIQTVTYEETDYYQIYRDFLNNRERYLTAL